MIRLVIFDVDGTLAEVYTLDLLPGVKKFFGLVNSTDCENAPRLAVATNQGGVGMRYWRQKRGKLNYEDYPKVEEIEQRLGDIFTDLGADSSIPVYVSYSYQTKEGNWTPVPPEEQGNPRWQREWRKPNPGMLLQAMQDADVSADETVFVGDSPEDRSAANAAGCQFAWAGEFFARDWETCEELKKLAEGEYSRKP